MLKRAQLAELSPRPGASAGLMRRRYSVPEIIMRKYRLAQGNSEPEECVTTTAGSGAVSPASPASPAGSCASLCEPPRFLRRDRELMRKSALMRRLWGRNNTCQTCTYCNADIYEPRTSRSLDGSRSELRHSSSRHSRDSNLPAGWATPKRQRLDHSSDNFHSSEELLRTAMKNSYDKTERETKESSDSTLQSHVHIMSSYVDSSSDTQYTDSHTSKSNDSSIEKNQEFVEVTSLNLSTETAEVISSDVPTQNLNSHIADGDRSTDTSESCSISMPTTKEVPHYIQSKNAISRPAHIDVHIDEASDNYENEDKNITPFVTTITPVSKSYDILEIVVSETLDTSPCGTNVLPGVNNCSPNKLQPNNMNHSTSANKFHNDFDIDEYVSNILVESLNSLTDQLESMNASIGSERKISIVEKEIKVKLQNTGVNTIVHLSPTSNNPIIFGNKELCNDDHNRVRTNESSNTANNNILIREEILSPESNNNVAIETVAHTLDTSQNTFSNEEFRSNNFDTIINHDNVNKAVLQQIQKLFQEELQHITPDNTYPENMMPSISHIEISNVDVYIDDNTNGNYESANTIELQTHRNLRNEDYSICNENIIGGVGTGNYFEDLVEPVVVPRFTAFPQTESMEVNTSSSEDAEVIGSDCTSLVDSLDDPNSPRSLILKKAYCNLKRSELVRSSIDILDLLPESESKDEDTTPTREKSESFFIRISDNDCDCEKENIVVAEHMPENIKQRLFRRHRKREMRMECAKHKKMKQLNREIEKQKHNAYLKSKKLFDKECMAVVHSLIDEVIFKIAQDEHKCAKIKQKTKYSSRKSNENISSKPWKRSNESLTNLESFRVNKNGDLNFSKSKESKEITCSNRNQLRGKLSLQNHSQSSSDDGTSKRIYQKSEIQDGTKRIEILEILEYADTSQSSPEGTNSDDGISQNYSKRKSRIPVPVNEKLQKTPKRISHVELENPQYYRSSLTYDDANEETNRLIANMLFSSLNGSINRIEPVAKSNKFECDAPPRRASVPQQESRSRSNSLRFRQIFDIIPEEKSSLSIESSNDDINYNRRVSAPTLSNSPKNECTTKNKSIQRNVKNASTSPMGLEKVSRTVMTSPMRRSAATSPLARAGRATPPPDAPPPPPPRPGWLALCGRDAGPKENKPDTCYVKQQKSPSSDSVQDNRNQSTARPTGTKPDSPGDDKQKPNPKKNNKVSETKTTKSKEKKTKTETKENIEKQEKRITSSRQENKLTRSMSDSQTSCLVLRKQDKVRTISVEQSKAATGAGAGGDSSSDSESGSSLLCSLAPRWLGRSRRAPHRAHTHTYERKDERKNTKDLVGGDTEGCRGGGAGGWSVTLAGGGGAALPADVEMRLSFPPPPGQPPPAASAPQGTDTCGDVSGRGRRTQQCVCRHCPECSCGRSPVPSLPPAPVTALALRKNSTGSSVLAPKSRKTSEALPELHRARARARRAVQTRRACSLHCWLPRDVAARPLQTSEGLLVCGAALVPRRKPRVPSMSERDLTRRAAPAPASELATTFTPALRLPRATLATLV